jgi:hypothetical protein
LVHANGHIGRDQRDLVLAGRSPPRRITAL